MYKVHGSYVCLVSDKSDETIGQVFYLSSLPFMVPFVQVNHPPKHFPYIATGNTFNIPLTPFPPVFFIATMVDTKPLLPASNSDGSYLTGSRVNRLKPIKVYLTIFCGLLAVGLFAALLLGNYWSDNARIHGTQRQHGSLASSPSKRTQPLRPVSRGPAQGVSEKTSGIWAGVSRGPAQGLSEKTSGIRAGVPENMLPDPWNTTMLEWQRTAFHFQPEQNWMNGII